MTDAQVAFESFRDWLRTTIIAIDEMEQQEEEPMKVTIDPAGTVTFDVDDIKDAIGLVNGLRDGNGTAVAESAAEFQARKIAWEAVQPPVAPKKRVRRKNQRKPATVLSPALAEVHAYLVEHAGPATEGVSAVELAQVFGTKVPAMSLRLRELKKRGLAENPARGLWRAAK